MSKEENSGSGGWWGNFIKSAKEKSLSAMEVIKSDLAEFTSTMSTDATNLLNEATANSTDQQQTSTSSFFKSITKSISEITENFNFNPETKDDYLESGKIVQKSSSSTSTSIHDRLKKDLELLQNNEQTFLSEPQDANYKEWEENFNSDNFKMVISDLLIENSAMRLIYSQLVPAQLSNIQFWSRYFFKVNQIEEEHKKRVKIIEKATIDAQNDEKDIDWDDDEETTPVSSQPENKQAVETNEQIEDQKEDQKEEKTENKIEKTASEESEKLVKCVEESAERKESLTQSSISKTEDSDEWERVSTVVVSENEEKVDYEEVNANKPQPEDKTEHENEKTDENVSKKRENLLSKLEKKDEKSTNLDAEWDEWE